MQPRQIDAKYHVSGQIRPEDLDAIAAAGFSTVICNRPDAEVQPELRADRMRQKAEALGLAFHELPLTHDAMTEERIARQAAIVEEAPGPVLAYCASGTRCTVAWALMQAGTLPVEEILTRAAEAGYDLRPLAPHLASLAAARAERAR